MVEDSSLARYASLDGQHREVEGDTANFGVVPVERDIHLAAVVGSTVKKRFVFAFHVSHLRGQGRTQRGLCNVVFVSTTRTLLAGDDCSPARSAIRALRSRERRSKAVWYEA